MKKKFMVGLILGLLMLCVTTGVNADTAAFSINSANGYGDSYGIPQSFGFVFTPRSDIVVSSLGFFDYLGDGLGESHKVGIFDSTGTVLSSAVVSAGTNSQWVDDFRYTDIAPLTLKAGHSYTIAALVLRRADIVGYADVADAQFNPAISVSSVPARYIFNTQAEALELPTETECLISEFFYGPNFKIANATSNANLIDLTYGEGAGSFELGNFVNGGGIPEGAGIGYMGVAPGDSTTITGWTVGGPGDGVDWLVEPFANADTGIHSVDLQHTYNSSISTIIPTITGNDYLLSFSAAVGINAPPYLPSAEGVVSAGSLVNKTFTTEISDDYETQSYLQFTYLFTATDAITTIVFQGTGPTGPPSYYGPVIDSVSVTDDISELFQSGTGSLGNTVQTASTYNFSLVQDTQATCSIHLFNPGNEDQIVSLEVLNAHSELYFSFQSQDQDLITVDSKSLQTIPVFIDATNAPAGVYDVLLKISTENGETLYSNLSVTIVEDGTQDRPDLSICSQNIQLTDYTLGDTATLQAVVKNQSITAASDVIVQFYELGTFLGEATLTEVAAEGTGTATITIPIGTSEGDHLIQVVVDPSNSVPELDETNNEASKIVTWGTPSTNVGNILVTGSSPSTVYAGELFTVSGKAVYDVYVDGVRYTEYVVKGGSVEITVKDNNGNEWIYGGIHTDVNGNFKKDLQAPEALDAYQLFMTVTDKTFTGTRELVFQVVEKPATPQEPPVPPTVTGTGYWTYVSDTGVETWTWTWTNPPVNEPLPQTDLRVFSENIYFSNNNPAPEEDITIFAEINYWATSTDITVENVPINVYATYPGSDKEKIGSTVISSLSVGSPDFGSRYIYGTWKNQGQGIYIIEVEIDPSFTEENMLNNAATRAIIVGEIESYQGIIQGQVTNAWGGVADAIIELYDSSMTTLIASKLTDTNGHYLFDSVPVGDCQVHIVTPDEYEADAETKPTEVVDQEISVVDFFLTKIESLCGDLDHDGDVDGTDRNILRAAFGTLEGDAGFIQEADYDRDGNIDYSDYQLWYYCYKQYAAGL